MTQTLVNLSINSYSNFHTVISALMLFSEKHKLAIASSVLSMRGNNRLHNLAYNNHRDKQNSGRCTFYTHTHTHPRPAKFWSPLKRSGCCAESAGCFLSQRVPVSSHTSASPAAAFTCLGNSRGA